MTDDRPDPEYLLELIKKVDERSKGGKLKIFFGMAAGVGKTYAMLDKPLSNLYKKAAMQSLVLSKPMAEKKRQPLLKISQSFP